MLPHTAREITGLPAPVKSASPGWQHDKATRRTKRSRIVFRRQCLVWSSRAILRYSGRFARHVLINKSKAKRVEATLSKFYLPDQASKNRCIFAAHHLDLLRKRTHTYLGTQPKKTKTKTTLCSVDQPTRCFCQTGSISSSMPHLREEVPDIDARIRPESQDRYSSV